MNDLSIETHTLSLHKLGEELCGDTVVEKNAGKDKILVLSDGLGSGVKANILSTLSSTMIATMIGKGVPLQEVMDTVLKTLPVCKIRDIAYSTFTVFHIRKGKTVTIFNYDNPEPVILRQGKHHPLNYRHVEMSGRKVSIATHGLQTGDALLAMSDGCVHAGVGAELNFGWQRHHIIEYLEAMYMDDYSARTLAELLIDECDSLYHFQPGDDTTTLALKVTPRKNLNLFVGPPAHKDSDEKAMSLYLSKKGKRVICGGSTAQMFARYMDKPLEVNMASASVSLPPAGKIEGIDLVSEGIITLSHVLKNAKAHLEGTQRFIFQSKNDTVSKLCYLLFEEATDIHFFVGKAINPAHQNPDLPIDHTVKMRIITDLKATLETMGKTVRMSQF